MSARNLPSLQSWGPRVNDANQIIVAHEAKMKPIIDKVTVAASATLAALLAACTPASAVGVATAFTAFAAIDASKVVYADTALILDVAGAKHAGGVLVTATGVYHANVGVSTATVRNTVTAYYDEGGQHAGALNIETDNPDPADVRAGTTYGAAGDQTGTLDNFPRPVRVGP